MPFSFTNLDAALGAYWRDYHKEILEKAYEIEELRQIPGIDIINEVNDQYIAVESVIDELIQAYQVDWTPKGTLKFEPETIQNFRIKVDFTFVAKEFEKRWTAQMKSNGSKAYDPFIEGMVWNKIFKKMMEDLNDAEINGVVGAITPGTPTASSASMNGLLKIIADAITATKITPYSTGAIDGSNIVTKVQDHHDNIPAKYRNRELITLISSDNVMRYFRRKKADEGTHHDYEPGKTTIEFTKNKLIGLNGMNGSDRFITTFADNLALLQDDPGEENMPTIEHEKRTTNVFTDFKRGVGFKITGEAGGGVDKQLIWTNDQA